MFLVPTADVCLYGRDLSAGISESLRRVSPASEHTDDEEEEEQPQPSGLSDAHISRLFQHADRNSDGRITRAELIKACRADAHFRSVLGLPERIQDHQVTASPRLVSVTTPFSRSQTIRRRIRGLTF